MEGNTVSTASGSIVTTPIAGASTGSDHPSSSLANPSVSASSTTDNQPVTTVSTPSVTTSSGTDDDLRDTTTTTPAISTSTATPSTSTATTSTDVCVLCLEDNAHRLYCCSGFIHLQCVTLFIASEARMNRLVRLRCPYCRRDWNERGDFDFRDNPETLTARALVLFAGARDMEFQRRGNDEETIRTGVIPRTRLHDMARDNQSWPRPILLNDIMRPLGGFHPNQPPAGAGPRAWYGPGMRAGYGPRAGAGPRAMGPRTMPPLPPLPPFQHPLEVEGPVLDLFPDEDSDFDLDELPTYAEAMPDRHFIGRDIIRIWRLEEGEIIELEDDLSLVVINGRLVALAGH